MNAAHVLNQRIAKSFCFRPLTDVLTRKSNAPPGGPHFWVKFPAVRSLTRVKCPEIARRGMGGFGIDWYIRPSQILSEDCFRISLGSLCTFCHEWRYKRVPKRAQRSKMPTASRMQFLESYIYIKYPRSNSPIYMDFLFPIFVNLISK